MSQQERVVLNNDSAGRDSQMFPVITKSSHPVSAAAHIIIKAIVVAAYLILPLLSSSFNIKMFVILAAAVDFWIVKNLNGRLLVGLRWWIDFDESGEQQWKFECKVDERSVNGFSEKAFWWTLVLFSLVWCVLVVINVLKLDITEVVICVFCAVLLIFNLYSYYRCSKVQSENVDKLIKQYGQEAAGKFMMGSIIANYA